MNKAQWNFGIVAGFVSIIIFLVIVIFLFRPSTTGNIVLDKNGNQINFIAEPFELRAWVVSPDGIQLDIQNNGKEDYSLNSIEIVGCGESNSAGRLIAPKESRIFAFPCLLEDGAEFSGRILIVYENPDGEINSVEGVLVDIV